jgi:S-adenosylmethionine decarboxylase
MQLRGVPPQHINDSDRLLTKLNALVDELALTRVSDHCHYFEPGVSAVIILSESHLAVHTWPELGYMHVDIVTCVEKLTRDSLQSAFQEAFEAEFVETAQLKYD